MKKHVREVVKLIKSTGLDVGEVEESRNHMHFHVTASNGNSAKLVTSKSPSDHRAMLAIRSNCRKIIRGEFAAMQR